MAMSDFLKIWKVVSRKRAPGVRVEQSVLCIYPDPPVPTLSQSAGSGGTKITIHYRKFGARYPSFQNAHYDASEDTIVGILPRDKKIILGIQDGKLIARLPKAAQPQESPKSGHWHARAISRG